MLKTKDSEVLLEGSKRVNALLTGLSAADKRKFKGWLARRINRSMRKHVREVVLSSDISRFEGNPKVRKRKAREFQRLVGTRVVAEGVSLFDNETGLGVKKRDQSLPGDKATSRQAARIRELGITQGGRPRKSGKLPRQRVLRKKDITGVWSRKKAGWVIRLVERKKLGAPKRGINRPTERRRGRILPVVWRRRKKQIIADIKVRPLLLGFLRTKRARARKGIA